MIVPTVEPGVASEAALVDDDDGGEALDEVDVRPCPSREPVAGERWKGLGDLMPRLRGDRVEHQGRLAGAGDADEDHESVPGDVDVKAPQIVGSCTSDPDLAHARTVEADQVRSRPVCQAREREGDSRVQATWMRWSRCTYSIVISPPTACRYLRMVPILALSRSPFSILET